MNELQNSIDPEIVDTLYELGNVGVGMAGNVLGKMLGISIAIGIPHVLPVDADTESIIRDDPEKIAIGVLMNMEKALKGSVLFVIDSGFLSGLVKKLTGSTYTGEALVCDEDSLSAIQEVVNIMAAAYMKAIGSYTGIRIYLSPVMVGVDMIGALISYPVAQLGIDSEMSVCVDTGFSVMGKDVSTSVGRIIMFPNADSVRRIVDILNK